MEQDNRTPHQRAMAALLNPLTVTGTSVALICLIRLVFLALNGGSWWLVFGMLVAFLALIAFGLRAYWIIRERWEKAEEGKP